MWLLKGRSATIVGRSGHDRATIGPRSPVDRGSSRKNASRSLKIRLSGRSRLDDQAAPRL